MHYVTTFKIFKHNFWTNEWSRFLYEGKYYRFMARDISAVEILPAKYQRVIFTIPRVWLKEYEKGVFMAWKEFPKALQAKMEKYNLVVDDKEKKKIFTALQKELKAYFVKKITITNRQAKVLLNLQTMDISAREAHKIHKKIGLE